MPAPATPTVERVTWWPLLNELPGSDITLNVATMKRLRQLPVSMVHAGHDPSLAVRACGNCAMPIWPSAHENALGWARFPAERPGIRILP
jgi:hypothetical protein